jgi:hypothetical protein
MPVPSFEAVERPARTLDLWWVGPVSIGVVDSKLTAITTMRRGDKSGVSDLPSDSIDLRTMDLIRDLGDDQSALVAVQQVISGIEIIAASLMRARGLLGPVKG